MVIFCFVSYFLIKCLIQKVSLDLFYMGNYDSMLIKKLKSTGAVVLIAYKYDSFPTYGISLDSLINAQTTSKLSKMMYMYDEIFLNMDSSSDSGDDTSSESESDTTSPPLYLYVAEKRRRQALKKPKLMRIDEASMSISKKPRQPTRRTRHSKDLVVPQQSQLIDFFLDFYPSVTDNLMKYLDTDSRKALSLASRECFNFMKETLTAGYKLNIPRKPLFEIKKAVGCTSYELLVCEEPNRNLIRAHDTVSIDGNFYASYIPENVKSLSLKDVTYVMSIDVNDYKQLEHLEVVNSYVTTKQPNRTVKSVVFRSFDYSKCPRTTDMTIEKLKFENLEKCAFHIPSSKPQYSLDVEMIPSFFKNNPTIKNLELACFEDLPRYVFEAIRDYLKLEELHWINSGRHYRSKIAHLVNEFKYLRVFEAPSSFMSNNEEDMTELKLNSIESLDISCTSMDNMFPKMKPSTFLKTLKLGNTDKSTLELINKLYPNLEHLDYRMYEDGRFNLDQKQFTKLTSLIIDGTSEYSVDCMYAPELRSLRFSTGRLLLSREIKHIATQFPKLETMFIMSGEKATTDLLLETLTSFKFVPQFSCSFRIDDYKFDDFRSFLVDYGCTNKLKYRQLKRDEKAGDVEHIIELRVRQYPVTFAGRHVD